MKILVPYIDDDGRSIDSPVISGGIEMFIKKLYRHIPEVIIVEVTKEEKSKYRVLLAKMKAAIEHHAPDIIMCNYSQASLNVNLQKYFDIPVMWVNHLTAGFLSSLGAVPKLYQHAANGNTVWYVSPHQFKNWRKLSTRLGKELPEPTGYIVPSVVEYQANPLGNLWDVATVGRCEPSPDKDPFLVHRRNDGTFRSMVMSNPKTNDYFKDNFDKFQDKDQSRFTRWGLKHDEILAILRNSQAFVTTWPGETYGIVSLEALSQGCPIILNCQNDSHASEIIPVKPDHFIKVSNRDRSGEETRKAVKHFITQGSDLRSEIAELTYEKYNVEAWKKSLYNKFDRVLEQHKANVNMKPSVMDFV